MAKQKKGFVTSNAQNVFLPTDQHTEIVLKPWNLPIWQTEQKSRHKGRASLFAAPMEGQERSETQSGLKALQQTIHLPLKGTT